MAENTVYCNKCKYLELHSAFPPEADECGRFEEIGKKFYCRLHEKYFDFETTERTIGLCACAYGAEVKNESSFNECKP